MFGPNQELDSYFTQGCGRCPRGGTPQCSVLLWPRALATLRHLALQCGLAEERKWGAPCYTHRGKNVAIIGAFRDSCVLSFFKGAMLADPQGLLSLPGENTQMGRVVRITNEAQPTQWADGIKALLLEAMELAAKGAPAPEPAAPAPLPAELAEALAADPELAAAFEALTPGRQRSHCMHIAAAKQPATRRARVANCRPKVLLGLGFTEYAHPKHKP
jgi:uncharacterized protein YdeI (YjbR/CyaY-like superfamily)